MSGAFAYNPGSPPNPTLGIQSFLSRRHPPLAWRRSRSLALTCDPEGKRAAYERIRSVVERLCFQLWDDPHREVYDARVHEALDSAVRRMNAPVLAAAKESRTAP